MAPSNTNEYRFEIVGGLDVDTQNHCIRAHDGAVIGFRLPDGRTVRLVMCLEIESADGEEFTYLPECAAMDEIGFSNLDYDHLTFFPTDEDNDDDPDDACAWAKRFLWQKRPSTLDITPEEMKAYVLSHTGYNVTLEQAAEMIDWLKENDNV